MHAEYFFVNNCSNGHSVEHITKYFPKLQVIPSFALVVKPIKPVNASRLVVASENEEIFRMLDFIGQE